ncbi:MAG: NAD-dependent epimerase/dehydratase family protein [Magnetococcus sp. MYC-9]
MSQLMKAYYDAVVPGNATLQRALAQLAGSRCLITGANGIIGYALSRLLDGYATTDLHLAVRNPHFTGREMLSERVTCIDYASLSGERFDHIFHFACHSAPRTFLAEWQATVRLNTSLLLDLLEATNHKLVFASSVEIYAGLPREATEEDWGGTTAPQHPRGIYIESKRVGEALCKQSGLGSASRIAYAAGPYPGPTDSRVLFELIRKGRARQAVSLLDGHHSIRQYQYTGACALRALVAGLLGREPVYNNAGPIVETLESIAQTIAAKLGVPYLATPAGPGVVGAPKNTSYSMDRFHGEFPEMQGIDPSFDQFIDWVVRDCP